MEAIRKLQTSCLYRSPSLGPAILGSSFHRRMIYKKDGRAVQIDLSFSSLAKCIKLSKKVTKGTFDDMIRPWDDPEALLKLDLSFVP